MNRQIKMNIENQVCNLQLSQKLKTLGVKQEGLFHWIKAYYDKDDCYVDEPVWLITPKYNSSDSNIVDFVSAFTVAELGELLHKSEYTIIRQFDGYSYVFRQKKSKLEYGMIGGHGMAPENTEADARAKMLCYLLENNLLPAPSERG